MAEQIIDNINYFLDGFNDLRRTSYQLRIKYADECWSAWIEDDQDSLEKHGFYNAEDTLYNTLEALASTVIMELDNCHKKLLIEWEEFLKERECDYQEIQIERRVG